jgi:nitroreductase
MSVDTVDRQTIRAALELGSHAPSIHNSQPWRWRRDRHSLLLQADLRRWLPVTDADGRDLVLSCGAALHHTRAALAAAGVHTAVHRIPNPQRPDDLAALELSPLRYHPGDADVELATAILRRRTDRRRYTSWDVPKAMRAALVQRAAEQGALLRVITGNARRKLESALRDAAAIQDNTPGYGTETAIWSGAESGNDGVPAANLLVDPPDPAHGRRFAPGHIRQLPSDEPDGALLAVLGTTSDDTLSRLRAGEALSAVLLHATRLGLASCPLSQVLEVGDTRRALCDAVLDGAMAPQIVLRLGFAPSEPPLPPTPRRPISEILYTEPD